MGNSKVNKTFDQSKYFQKGCDLTDKELLIELGKRIKAGKVKGNSFEYGCCHGFTNLYTGRTQGTYALWKPEFKVNLHDGEITENKIDDKPNIEGQEKHEKATRK